MDTFYRASINGIQSIQELINQITYFNENQMMLEPEYMRQKQVLTNEKIDDFCGKWTKEQDIDSMYHVQIISTEIIKKQEKYSPKTNLNLQNQRTSQHYIKILQPILRSQIQAKSTINRYISTAQPQLDSIQSISRNEKKKKKITKTKRKQLKPIYLSQELNIRKKHLTKLWSNRINYFIRNQNTQKYNIPIEEIDYVKKQMTKSSITIQELSSILTEKQWLREVILKEQLLDDKPLEYIFKSNITAQSKLILFQTYDIFKQAIMKPEKFSTWDPERRRNTQQSQIFFNEKCNGKCLDDIILLLNEQFKDQLELYEKNKCSKQNNISYCWFSYLKDISNEAEFGQICNKNSYQQLQQILKMPASLKNIQHALQINQFSRYILNAKIKTESIFKDIITNQKINILNKKNMLETFSCFHSAVERPSTLKKWPKLQS